MSKKILKSASIALVAFMLLVTSLINIPGKTVVAGGEEGKSRLIVILHDGVSKKDVKDYVNKKGGYIKADYKIINGMAVDLESDKIAGLKGLKGVKKVGPDIMVHASDTELDASWGVKRIGAGTVHDNNKGANINVAVIDTGIYYCHSDLDANYRSGYDFVNEDPDPLDDNGHGTHVAGIIAAEDNNSGVVGVAPQASLYGLKVLNASGEGYVSDIISALDWCWNNDQDIEIDIINMSLGAPVDATGFHDAVSRAYQAGIVIVAAAGNTGKINGKGDSIEYPARYEEVIAVGAVDESDTRAYFSSTGSLLELAAPGVSVLSCIPTGYGLKSGTSMASPHVAGTAALILAGNPGLSPTSLRQILWDTADDLGAAGFDTGYGYGLVDADQAVLPAATGSISGTVSDGTNSIQGAAVSCGSSTVSTDVNGYYHIDGLAPGTYTVNVTADGYDGASVSVEVSASQNTIQNFTLTPAAVAGSISGTVSDGTNSIQGAAVSCGSSTVSTDVNGYYHIDGLAPGTYTVNVTADGYESAWASVAVESGQNATHDFILSAVPIEQQVIIVKVISYSTSGGKTGTAHLIVTPSVTDSSGQAVPNAKLSIQVMLNGSIYYTGSALTGSEGTVSFKLSAAPSGTYSTVIQDVQAPGYVWDGITPENTCNK